MKGDSMKNIRLNKIVVFSLSLFFTSTCFLYSINDLEVNFFINLSNTQVYMFSATFLACIYIIREGIYASKIRVSEMYFELNNKGLRIKKIILAIVLVLVSIYSLIVKIPNGYYLSLICFSLLIYIRLSYKSDEGLKGSFLYYGGKSYDLYKIKVITKDYDIVILEYETKYGVFTFYQKIRIKLTDQHDEFIAYIKTFDEERQAN